MVVVGGLVGGVILGLTASRALAVDMSVVPEGGGFDNLGVRVISAGVAALAAAISYYAPYKLLPAAMLSASLGMLIVGLCEEAGVLAVASYPLAAFAVGLLGYALANVLRSLPLMVVVPAITSLLPGLLIYTGLLNIGGDDPLTGIVSLGEAGARGLGIAAAVLVAELIGQPVRRRLADR